MRGHRRAPRRRSPLLRAPGALSVPGDQPHFPMHAQPRVWRVVQGYVDVRARRPGPHAPERIRRPRPAAAVPRDDASRHAVPADAAASQRLLPVAPAPGRDRGGRAGRRRAAGRAAGRVAAPNAPSRPAAVPAGRHLGSADAPGRRRGRHLHRRRPGRRRRRAHGQGADDARRPVARASWPPSSARSRRAGARRGDVEGFAHGMTVATNALLEGTVARTALRRHRRLHRRRRARPPGAARALPAVRRAPGAADAARAALRRARAHRARRRARGARPTSSASSTPSPAPSPRRSPSACCTATATPTTSARSATRCASASASTSRCRTRSSGPSASSSAPRPPRSTPPSPPCSRATCAACSTPRATAGLPDPGDHAVQRRPGRTGENRQAISRADFL